VGKVFALIPARSGSKGIPNKNFTPLAGRSPMNRAINVCNELRGTLHDYYVSSDVNWAANERRYVGDAPGWRYGHWLLRPESLAQDDTPMIDVVTHALDQIPGEPEDIWLLLQPTQVLREPKHLIAAIEAMRTGEWDSVVSITPIPKTHAPAFVVMLGGATLQASPYLLDQGWGPSRRQDVPQPYVRDGTVYAFTRDTVARFGSLYGEFVRGLIIPASETCPLDTLEDWDAAERRLRERQAQA
jgi:CMP-N,N'-diacetyllegionaminic acid synthase